MSGQAFSTTISRVPTGVLGFDEMIQGGFPQGRPILIIGETGAGKTIFCSQFLYNGFAKYGDNGVYVSLKERKQDFLTEMDLFGWDFATEEKRRFNFVDAKSQIGAGTEKLLGLILEGVNEIKARRVVIDSVTDLTISTLEEKRRWQIIVDLTNTLLSTGATCLLVSDFPTVFTGPFFDLDMYIRGRNVVEVEKHFAHGTIVLENSQVERGKRIIWIEKMRATLIDRTPRPYSITERGIEVHPRG